jgi:hypothetical protein
MSDPKYIDLDALAPEVDVVIKLDGQSHKLATLTVEDFIQNTKAIQELPAGSTIEQEYETVVSMLVRCFPTITKARFHKLSLVQLNAILNFARENSGQTSIEEDMKKENPPPAG